ncbi:hypothetical protein B0H14DRAFT_2661907 [Mycena olivaceomarginata]|nr:hypothetical protein B0H14DRAFT_2661907 [Mycena olivaceomarginata]
MPSTYELFRIPVPPSEEDVIKYSKLRLLGLKQIQRLSEERFTIIARLVSRPGNPREEWVGTASILTPTMWAQSDADTYGVVGIRKGLGKKLLEFGIEWVRTRTEGNPTATRLALEVHRANEGAKKLYDGLAFVESRDELCEDPNRIPLFLAVK